MYPKPNFGVRPAVVIDPVDRLVYQSLVDTISKSAIGELKDFVFGWRLVPDKPKNGVYARNTWQWDNYRNRLQQLAIESPSVLKTDIVSFFASVPVSRIIEALESRAGTGDVVRRIGQLLEEWDRMFLRSGLPQRFLSSSVLANMYLSPVDDFLATFKLPDDSDLIEHFDTRAVRWMDDIWLFGHDPRELRKAQLRLNDLLGELGLHINYGKTNVVDGIVEVVEAVEALEHGYIDVELAKGPSSAGFAKRSRRQNSKNAPHLQTVQPFASSQHACETTSFSTTFLALLRLPRTCHTRPTTSQGCLETRARGPTSNSGSLTTACRIGDRLIGLLLALGECFQVLIQVMVSSNHTSRQC